MTESKICQCRVDVEESETELSLSGLVPPTFSREIEFDCSRCGSSGVFTIISGLGIEPFIREGLNSWRIAVGCIDLTKEVKISVS